jgi:hypothetical protein
VNLEKDGLVSKKKYTKYMMLKIPDYINNAAIVDKPIQHSWNDKFPSLLYREDERLGDRIDRISVRGVVGLSAGFAEWIAWRFVNLCDDPVLFSYIEAVWAGIVDWRYLRPIDQVAETPYASQWRGPVRGPVCRAFDLIDRIVRAAMEPRAASMSASGLSQLALAVMPNPGAYKDWRRYIIKRLSESNPAEPDEELGRPLSREALNPGIDYQPEREGDLIADFLEGLSHEKNPFLNSPKEMLEAGFVGTPYQFEH